MSEVRLVQCAGTARFVMLPNTASDNPLTDDEEFILALDDEIAALRAQLEEARAAATCGCGDLFTPAKGHAGICPNCLEAQLAAKDAEAQELRQSLQAALQRAKCAERDAEATKALATDAIKTIDALQARVTELAEAKERLEVALLRIEGHTNPNVVPGTPAPDPLWINRIARAALADKGE